MTLLVRTGVHTPGRALNFCPGENTKLVANTGTCWHFGVHLLGGPALTPSGGCGGRWNHVHSMVIDGEIGPPSIHPVALIHIRGAAVAPPPPARCTHPCKRGGRGTPPSSPLHSPI